MQFLRSSVITFKTYTSLKCISIYVAVGDTCCKLLVPSIDTCGYFVLISTHKVLPAKIKTKSILLEPKSQ